MRRGFMEIKYKARRGLLTTLVVLSLTFWAFAQKSTSEQVDDFGFVHSILVSAKFYEPKSEFETKEQYEKRISLPPFIKIGSKSITDKFIFRWATYNSLNYNAENETMKFELTKPIVDTECSYPSLSSRNK